MTSSEYFWWSFGFTLFIINIAKFGGIEDIPAKILYFVGILFLVGALSIRKKETR